MRRSNRAGRPLTTYSATYMATLPLSPADKHFSTPVSPPRLVLIATAHIALTATHSPAVVDSARPCCCSWLAAVSWCW